MKKSVMEFVGGLTAAVVVAVACNWASKPAGDKPVPEPLPFKPAAGCSKCRCGDKCVCGSCPRCRRCTIGCTCRQ